jgi:type III secretion system YscQ/HrcQ family protein
MPGASARQHTIAASAPPLHERLQALLAWQAAASRLLFDRRAQRFLPAGCAARAAWVGGSSAAPQDADACLVQVRFGDAPGSVSALVASRLSDLLPQAIDPSMDPGLQASLIQFATRETTSWTEALGIGNLRALQAEQVQELGPALGEQIEVRWSQGRERSGRLRLMHADAPVLSAVQARLEAVNFDGSRFGALRVAGHMVLGQRQMPVARADGLRPGDLILPQTELEAGAPIRGRLLFGERQARHWGAPACLQDRTITIEGKPSMSNGSASSSGDAALHDQNVRISDIDIPISFEIETTDVTLAALESIEPGYVFELPMAAAGATVRLTVYGQVIGQGELVSVGDQLGVRVLRIGASHAVGSGS